MLLRKSISEMKIQIHLPESIKPIRCYLEHIRRTFMYLVGDDTSLLPEIDAVTVRIIQSRAPAISFEDLRHLEGEWEKGKLFQSMRAQDREFAWERLKNIGFIIPTLATFFQDVLFLEVTQAAMRKLCLSPPEGAGSIDKILLNQHVGYLRSSESLSTVNEAILKNQLLDLWRFSSQHAFELTDKKDHHRRVPRKTEDIERAIRLNFNRSSYQDPTLILGELSSLAYNYGFEIPSHIQFHEPQALIDEPSYFPPDVLDDVDLERRCGKPFTDSVDADRFALSRSSLFQTWIDPRVSTGFVRRCVFFSFFSYLFENTHYVNRFQSAVYPPETEDAIQSIRLSSAQDENLATPSRSNLETEFLETFGDMPWDMDGND